MIRRLRMRMTLLVVAVLILVSVGIVLAIWYANERAIISQAERTLAVLAENSGSRPSALMGSFGTRMDFLRESEGEEGQTDPDTTPPPRPSWEDDGRGFRRLGGLDGLRDSAPETVANLSNYYTVTLTDEGAVESWNSDRSDLYTDDQVSEMARAAQAEGKESGRIGTQFYRFSETENQRMLIVLDARMEYLSASHTLQSTAIVAGSACLLLSLLAWLMIRRMVRPVEEAFIRQKQFVSDASHELKTPLAVISANAEVLEAEIGENEYLGYIRSEVSRTNTLVQHLLTLARMDQGRVKAEMKAFDLSRAVLDVALPMESTIYEAGKSLELDVPEGISCTGNEDMLKQLTVILLSNALKYSDEKGRIRLSLKEKGRQTELTVWNSGEPIPPEDQEKIFDRFWRGDASHNRESGGHGLGLAIARTIVEIHHGRIAVSSREGQGTAFTVTLG